MQKPVGPVNIRPVRTHHPAGPDCSVGVHYRTRGARAARCMNNIGQTIRVTAQIRRRWLLAHIAQRGQIDDLASCTCGAFCCKASDFRVVNNARRSKIKGKLGNFDFRKLGGAGHRHQSHSNSAEKTQRKIYTVTQP